MRNDSLLVAIEAALRSPSICPCGETLDIAARDGSIWLECRSFRAPSRLPARLVDFVRTLVHARSYIGTELEDASEDQVMAEAPVAARRGVTQPVRAAA